MMTEDIHKQIELRAYEVWQYRQHYGMLYVMDKHGDLRDITEQDDWLEAEKQILHAQEFHRLYDIGGDG